MDLADARLNMVESQVRTADVTDTALHDAMRKAPREALLPAAQQFAAYADAEPAYGPGRWLLKPRDVGKLLQALQPNSGEAALAISAPYAAALLELMGLTVTQVDAGEAKTALAGPYDLIICEGAVAKAPAAWTAALASGGRLGVVERDGPVGRAVLYQKTDGGIAARPIFDSTPPMMAGFEATAEFSF